jgi:hypothetical protein
MPIDRLIVRLEIPRPIVRVEILVACASMLAAAVCAAPTSALAGRVGSASAHANTHTGARAHAAEHFACGGPDSSHRPCYFSTPSGNIRCVWTPRPNRVTCEMLASGRADRLGPTGSAKAVHVKLTRRGETLPTNQMLVFPDEFSCQDTKVAVRCNQDEGTGEFKLPPHGGSSI